jgi:hypothetical protein
MEDLVDLKNKAQALENTPTDILLNMSEMELNNMSDERNKIIKKIDESRFNLEEFYQGKKEDIDEIEEDGVNRVDDYSYIFSKYNKNKEIPIDRWYGVIDKETGNAPPGGVEPAIIYSDHIPKHAPLFERNDHKQYVKMIIEDENGIIKPICGKILRIFSNLTAFSTLDDDPEEEIFYPQKGQWIYHINFVNGKSIIVAESRKESVMDEKGKETEILKQQIITDEPTPYKVTNTNDFTIQLITQLEAMRLCGSEMATGSIDIKNKPEDLSLLNEIDNTAFDLLLSIGYGVEIPLGSDALRIDNESPDGVDNSFISDDGDDYSSYIRENYLPHPPVDDDRRVLVNGQTITRSDAINRSPENSPARLAQTRNDAFRQRIPLPQGYPMFPGPLSAPSLSDSARFLAGLSDDDDINPRHVSAISNLPEGSSLDAMANAIRANSRESDSSSSGSISFIPNETTRRQAATRLQQLGNTQSAIGSLSGTRRQGDFQEVRGRNVTPRVGSPLPIPPTMDNLSPLSSPQRTPSESNSPQVVPETPESQMGNPDYYRRQNEPDHESTGED